jgi:hypothetical protein
VVTIQEDGTPMMRKLNALVDYIRTYQKLGPILLSDLKRFGLSKLLSPTIDAKNNDQQTMQPQTFELSDKLLTTQDDGDGLDKAHEDSP